MSVSVLSMWYAFRLTCQYHQSCLKLTTQGHLFLIHLLVEKPHAHSSSNSIIRLDFFFSGEVLADTFVSFHLETRFVYAKA